MEKSYKRRDMNRYTAYNLKTSQTKDDPNTDTNRRETQVHRSIQFTHTGSVVSMTTCRRCIDTQYETRQSTRFLSITTRTYRAHTIHLALFQRARSKVEVYSSRYVRHIQENFLRCGIIFLGGKRAAFPPLFNVLLRRHCV